MSDFTLRLLHLSDLHERGSREKEIWRKRRVLGDEWLHHLEAIQEDGPIDLVCFTGDAADWGLAEEFEKATELFAAMLSALGLTWDRFFAVPGNHDIHRKTEEAAWKRLRPAALSLPRLDSSRWMAGRNLDRRFGASQREKLLDRQSNYRSWLTTIGRADLLPDPALHPHLGYRQTLRFPGHPFDFHVIGLDSAWLCGDNHDADKLLLTQDQIGELCTGDGDMLPGYRLVLVHHPLDHLADAAEARRLLGGRVDLLLRGHLHEPEVSTWADPDRQLRQIAAGCLYEGHGADQYPNACEVVEIRLDENGRPLRYDLRFRGWSPRGHWFDDGSLYRESKGGRLTWKVAGRVPPPDLRPQVQEVFVGREKELAELQALLLSPAQDDRPVAICAIEGMPGVGKSYLADRFASEFSAAFPGGIFRLVFDPKKPARAEDLLRDLADRLDIPGGGPDLAEAVRERLLRPRALLHVENVDGPAFELEATRLLRQLSGCAALVTGRVWDLGRAAGWRQVRIEPFDEALALQQLWKEIGRTPSRDEEREHRELLRALGGLPLAVHLAAGYLRVGRTAKGFLRHLRKRGLALEPVHAGELAVETSEAARKILSVSFGISLGLLTAELDNANAERLLDGFRALSHAPLSGFGRSLGAAIAGLSEEDFEELVVQARRLSLLLPVPPEERPDGAWRVHPLLAELLRRDSDQDAAFDRITEWFVERLPEPETGKEEEGGRRWREVQSETTALTLWLPQLQGDVRFLVERAGSTFAQRCGPFRLWLDFCENLVEGESTDQQKSQALLTLIRVAFMGGLLDRAYKAAREKLAIAIRIEDPHRIALSWGAIADILQSRGQLDEALRIRREEQIPVYEKIGDTQSRAITLGKIADILQKKGQLDEALRILKEELVPIFEMIGDLRSRAIALGKIANILQTRGQLDEAIHIRQGEEIPVYEKLQSRRDLLVGRANLAQNFMARGLEGDREQARELLCLALRDAEELRIPEADQIRVILTHYKLSCGPNIASPTAAPPADRSPS